MTTKQGNIMTLQTANGIEPEFYELLKRSEKLLELIRLIRESEPFNYNELHQLHNEVSQNADKMQAMLPNLIGIPPGR